VSEMTSREKLALIRTAVTTTPAVAQELKELGYFDKAFDKKQSPKLTPKNTAQVMMLGNGASEREMLGPARVTSVKTEYQDTHTSIVAKVVQGNAFEYSVLFLIVLNAMFIGLETDAVARDESASESVVFRVIGIVFMVIFALELLLRIFVFRQWFFRTKTPLGNRNPNLLWNVFDSFVVGFQVLEYILREIIDFEDSALGKVSILRLLRILRIGRLFRVGKLLRLFGSLRTIVHSISHSWKLFVWALISMMVINYLFAVYITEVVSGKLHVEDPDPDLKLYFGSVSDSMLSVAKAATGGIDWGDLYTPLRDVTGTFAAAPFYLFIMFMLIVVMNIFAGIFLNSVSQRADQELELQLLNNAYSIFKEADPHDSGTMARADFQEALSHPEVNKFFKAIDLDIQQAEVLFELLDVSNDGFISCDEFLRGCLRLHGTTKALDLLILSREVTQLFDSMERLHKENAEAVRVHTQALADLTAENHRLLTQLWTREDRQSSWC